MIQLYNPDNAAHQAALIVVFTNLVANEELEQTLAPSSHTPHKFLSMMQHSVTTFCADEYGIWFLGWFEPVFSGAFASTWVRKDRRGTKRHFLAMVEWLDKGLQLFPVLMGITKQKALLSEHYRLGYTLSGIIPSLWDGEDAYLMLYTDTCFAALQKRYGKGLLRWAEAEKVSP